MSDANDPAPGDLQVVQSLVNTADLEAGTDSIADPAGLAGWLREHGLVGRDDTFSPQDVERVLAFREALRRLLMAHNGAEVDPDAVATLEAAARASHVVVTFGPDGAPYLAPAGGGVGGALARVLGIIAQAEVDGTWARLKACPADDCQWAFYDSSRNRSRTWCTMSVCGNRAKARAYRRRAAGRDAGETGSKAGGTPARRH